METRSTVDINDPGDPRVALYRDVRDAVLLRSRDLFVAEGRLVVQRVLEDWPLAVRSLLLNHAALRALGPSLDRLPIETPVYVIEAASSRAVTGFNVHRGCLALVARPPDRVAAELCAASRTILILEGVTDPDNVGGVFRNAAALGGDAVLLNPACCDPLYRKAIRTSMGSTLRVPFARIASCDEALRMARAAGFTTVALTPREPSLTLDAFASGPRSSKLALVVGTEGEGLSDAVERAADVRVRIPMRPGVDSLNLAVASGIALARLGGDGRL